ncbi:MAG TPA: hypothetical protein VFH54_11825 [Mycobacteriales bacterium]|nr:hypothetical protein [Mycobacteriales bacterium]
MYGTTMIGTLADGVSAGDVQRELERWEKERNVPGFRSSHVMVTDDGKTVVQVAVFDTKESYLKLADDPVQDEWWQKHYAPMLAGEPQWIDGEWVG